jgi:PPP family 3-phenylpropionic acid transporter
MAVPLFITFIVYAVLTPYLPLLLRGLGYSPTVLGVLLGIFEGAGIAGPFIFGHFADRMGRYKPGLVIAHLMVLLAAFPLALCARPALTALLLVIIAVGFRSILPLLEAVTTLSLGKDGDYGRIRTAGSVSFILMVLFLQKTPVLRPDTPLTISFWISLTMAAALIAVLGIPARYTNTGRRFGGAAGNPQGGRIWSPLLILGLGVIFLSRLAMAAVNGFFSLFLVEYVRWDALGYMWALAAAAEIPFMYLSRRFINRFGALPLLALGSAAVILRLGAYALFPVKGGVIAGQLLHSLCYGVFHPAAVAFISSSVPPERRALGMSLYLSLGTGVPTFIGNILGGWIIDHWGYRALFGGFIVFPVMSLGLYAFIRFQRRK